MNGSEFLNGIGVEEWAFGFELYWSWFVLVGLAEAEFVDEEDG